MNKHRFIQCLLYACITLISFGSSNHAFAHEQPNAKDSSKQYADDNAAESTPGSNLKQQLIRAVLYEHFRWNTPVSYRENDSLMLDIMKAYWANLGQQVTSRQLQDSLWEEMHPWSAAFISWVMRRAGAGDYFSYAPNHATYIVAARNNVGEENAVFKAYDVKDSNAAWPQPGDLLCKNRDGKTYTLNTISKNCISHCDVVIESDSIHRTVTTIGGNVNNRVAKRIVFLDEKGFVDNNIVWCVTDDPAKEATGNQSDYFAVIKTGEVKQPVAQVIVTSK